MKKIFEKVIIVSSLLGLVFFYGCSEDDVIEEVASSINISLSATTSDGNSLVSGGNVTAADSFSIVISIIAEAGFNTLNISGDVASSTINRNDLDIASGTTNAEVTLTISTSSSLGDGSIDFEAVDDEGNTASASFSFVVVSPVAKIQTAVMLYAPLGDSSSQTFYSIANNQTYSLGDVISTSDPVSASIDFGYYYGSTDNAALASPAEYTIYDLSAWGSQNVTTLAVTTITSAEYLEMVTVSDIETAIAGVDVTDANGTVTNLSANDILMFKTVDNVQGLIHVSAITGTDGSDGMIELEMKLAASE
ncbi:MAG: hypothetical protein CBB92_13620 [Flammeovirgaceae bacterium TMED32]|nr:MAG: hypothetical protein CBB92_13620 [Flammeovirgaceae bacterium TMED32]